MEGGLLAVRDLTIGTVFRRNQKSPQKMITIQQVENAGMGSPGNNLNIPSPRRGRQCHFTADKVPNLRRSGERRGFSGTRFAAALAF